MEAKLKAKITTWLKDRGVYVIKPRVLPGVPKGCPDIIGLYRWKHVEIEVKASADAPFQTGQEATLAYLRKGNRYVYVVYPENWPDIQHELALDFF